MSNDKDKIRDLLAQQGQTLDPARANSILELSKRELRASFYDRKSPKAGSLLEKLTLSRFPSLTIGAVVGMVLLLTAQNLLRLSSNDFFAKEKEQYTAIEKNSDQELGSLVFVSGIIQSADISSALTHSERRGLIAVSIGSGKDQIKILGQGGSQVEISVNQRNLTFQLLEGANGEIILVSQNGIWTSDGTRSGDVSSLDVKAFRTSL